MKKIKYFFSFYKPHRKLFFIDIIASLFVALINLVYPFMAQKIINDFVPNNNLKMIFIFASFLLGIYIVKLSLNYFIQYWGHVVGVRIQADMRKTLFAKLEKLPYKYFDNNKSGIIMSRIINDLQEISELAHHGPEELFLSVVTFIGAFIMLTTIDYRLALIIFACIPFIVCFAVYRRNKQRDAFRLMRVKTGEINASVESSIAGIRVAKAYNAIDHEIENFNHSNTEFVKARNKAYRQMGIFFSGMNFLNDILYLVAILSGALFFYHKIIDSGEFTGYILYVNTLINPIRTLVTLFEQIQSGLTGFDRFVEIMNEEEEKEVENPYELTQLNQSITYNNISFAYEEKDENTNYVVKDFTLNIKKGSTVALVGPSGGGKTTLCHLLPRFYNINSGEILIDDHNINEVSLSSLRSIIGIVAQDVFLFSGTIKDNILYGKFSASEEEIVEACKNANIHDFIMGLEHGYDTYIGERGVKLSGGQKQRISIARAFLKNPDILILDEATSALDNVTEMLIQESLDKLSKDRTTIVVAHRLSTVKRADEIILIDKTGIVERGNHDQLMALDGTYKKLYSYQFRS